MTYLRFLLAVLTSAFVLLLAVVGFNLVIDPYGLYGFAIEGVNIKKPEARTHIVMGKRQRLIRAQPETVILGNSRADLGLDPESAYWPDRFGTVFNFAIPGEAMYGTIRRYDFARRHAPVRHFILPLDLMDFLIEQRPDPVFKFQQLELPSPYSFQNITKTLLSTTAFMDSVLTILGQHDPYAADITTLGFNPAKDFIPVIRLEGHHAVEDQKLRANFRKFLEINTGILRPDGTEAKPLQWLRLLLEDAREQNFGITILFYPVHANLLDVYDVTGRWAALEDLKRIVVDIVAEQQNINPAWQTAIWDFADYSHYTTEPFPPSGNRNANMQWYWESGHFKSTLGEIMLQRMFQNGPEGFGARLTTETVDTFLAGIRKRKAAYHAASPQYRETLKSWCRDKEQLCVTPP